MKATCTSCGAEIQFRYTINGKRMPLNIEPLMAWQQGAYVLDGQHGCLPATPLTESGKPMYLNHWASCPTRDLHRQGQRP
jgi:hypothetical protein